MNIWIVCPNLWGARVFRCDDLEAGPKFWRELLRPSHQPRHEDFAEDDDPELKGDDAELREEVAVARSMAFRLAGFLDRAVGRGEMTHLILCAEPKLLGILKENLTSRCKSKLVKEIPQDLYEINETDLSSYVQEPFIEYERRRI